MDGRRRALWIFLAGLAAWSLCSIAEHDTPWYLASGELILRTHALPAHDPFSYTSTVPWLNHEWLTEVLLALGHRALGWAGLVGLCAIGVSFPIAVLSRRRDAFTGAAPVVWLLAAFVLRETTSPRASLFSLALLAGTLALLLDDEDDVRLGGTLWWCLPLQLVWTQVHGGNPLGVVLLGLRWLTGPSRRRFAVATSCALATIAGPYGWQVHAHFLQARSALSVIREWQPLGPSLRAGVLAPWVFVGLAGVALVASARRATDARGRFFVVALALFGVAAMRWARFSTEATLLAAAALVPLFGERTRKLGPTITIPAAVICAALLSLGSTRRLGLGLDESRFPIAAVDWLRSARPAGPMFNSYNFGGYLLWARPEERVFIDGRAFTVYAPELIEELPKLYADPARWDALASRYGFRFAVLARGGRGGALNAALAKRADWRLVHEDPTAQIFIRSVP